MPFQRQELKKKHKKENAIYNKFSTEDFQYYFDRGTCPKQSRIEFVNEEMNFLKKASKIAKDNNIEFELSGIAGLALFLKLKDQLKIQTNDKVVIINTGKIKLELFK